MQIASTMAKYAVAIALVGVLLVSSTAAQSTSATTYCAGTSVWPECLKIRMAFYMSCKYVDDLPAQDLIV